jgi:hypothetical protein
MIEGHGHNAFEAVFLNWEPVGEPCQPAHRRQRNGSMLNCGHVTPFSDASDD